MNPRGFALVELLVAVAVGSIILLAIGGLYLSGLESYADSSAQTALQRQGSLALEEMARQIRPASALSVTTCDGVGGALQVTNANGTFCFYPDSSQQLIERLPGGSPFNLLSGSLASLTAVAWSATTDGTTATISFTLADGAGVEPMAFPASFKRRN